MKVDFHCHTVYSGDSLLEPAKMILQAKKIGLNKVAITDHNTIKGAMVFAELAPEIVIVGEEITVRKNGNFIGEILGYFLKEEVPGDLEIEEALILLRDQNAFISVAHPFDANRSKWTKSSLAQYTEFIDAIEVFNSRTLTSKPNRAAMGFAREHGIIGLNGSDAHSSFELGQSYVAIPEFSTADELRRVINNAQLVNRKSSNLVHFTTRIAELRWRFGYRP
ncbi:MAG: PHP domain-containing protein [Anaerolineaceae bacterium]|nr:PHP domain-containing protein [Anaerolineaceae bacterium]